MINILLVEDHNLVREGIKMLLEQDAELKVKAAVKTALDGLKFIENETIEVVLAASNIPDMEGVEFLNKVKRRFPKIKVIVLTDQNDKRFIAEVFKNKADGYLLKDVYAKELTFAVKFVSEGLQYVCADLSMNFVNSLIESDNNAAINVPSIPFSSREIEILQLMAQGYTNFEISEKLFLSKRTIEGHRQSLIEKSGSRNSAALIRLGVLHGVIK